MIFSLIPSLPSVVFSDSSYKQSGSSPDASWSSPIELVFLVFIHNYGWRYRSWSRDLHAPSPDIRCPLLGPEVLCTPLKEGLGP
jgi:hypothetical protein